MNLVEHIKNELKMKTLPNDVAEAFVDVGKILQMNSFISLNEETTRMLSRLIQGKPLTTLTGSDDEWELMTTLRNAIKIYRNIRCRTVYKEIDEKGNIIYSDSIARVFSINRGHSWFAAPQSKKEISFPYNVPDTPEHVQLQVIPIDDCDHTTCFADDFVELEDGTQGRLKLEVQDLTDIFTVNNKYFVWKRIKESGGEREIKIPVKPTKFRLIQPSFPRKDVFFYSHSEDQRWVDLDWEEAVEDLIEEEGLDEIPDEVEIKVHKVKDLTKAYPYRKGIFLDSILEDLDEDFLHEDDDFTKPTEEMYLAEKEFCEKIIKCYPPLVYGCDEIDTIKVDARPFKEKARKENES